MWHHRCAPGASANKVRVLSLVPNGRAPDGCGFRRQPEGPPPAPLPPPQPRPQRRSARQTADSHDHEDFTPIFSGKSLRDHGTRCCVRAGKIRSGWLIAVAQLVDACGEELGWRSFLRPHLQQRYSAVVSALIVGVLRGTWQVEYFSYGLLFVAAFVAMAVAISVILAQLTHGVSSLAVAGVFHWLLNLAVLLLISFANGAWPR
jgi:hypothetical protein